MDDLCSSSEESEDLQRRQHEQGGGETDALSGLAGAGRLQLAQVQPGHLSAELLLPRLQHLDAPFVILYAMYTMNKQSDAAQYHVHTAYMHSPHTGCVCGGGAVCVCVCGVYTCHQSERNTLGRIIIIHVETLHSLRRHGPGNI